MEYKVGELVQIKTREEVLAENHFCAKGSALHKYAGSTCRVQAVGTLYNLKPVNIVDNLPHQMKGQLKNGNGWVQVLNIQKTK